MASTVENRCLVSLMPEPVPAWFRLQIWPVGTEDEGTSQSALAYTDSSDKQYCELRRSRRAAFGSDYFETCNDFVYQITIKRMISNSR
jgi:hypothetical protein